jgi:DNA-binding CsgD family transcriptional regulator
VTVLRERDLRAVLDLMGEVNDADDLAAFRLALLDALPRAVPTDYVSYNEVPSSRGGAWVSIVVPELPGWAYEVWMRHGHQNPLVRRHLRTRDGRAYRFSDVVPAPEMHRLELYTELYRALGVEHQLAFCLPSAATITVGLALSRGGADFTERDRRIIDLARPHLIQAYRNAELRERTRRVLEAIGDGLDDAGQAIVVLERDGRIAFATAEARRLLQLATGTAAAAGDRLPEPLGDWLGDGARSPLLLHRGFPLAVRHVDGTGGRPSVLFLEQGLRRIGAGALRDLGLTPRQAEVLHHIVRGRGNDEIAAALEISPRTVHKHVEHVFARLGVRSRLEAVATVWAAVGVDGVPR